MDGPAAEYLDLLEELDVLGLATILALVHEDVDVVISSHRQQLHSVLTGHRR